MSQGNDITRQIPDNLGGTDTILDDAPIVGDVQVIDGLIAFGPSFFILFLMEQVLPQSLSIIAFIFAAIMFLGGVFTLLAKPSYLTLYEWIGDIRQFKKRPDKYRKALPTTEGQSQDEAPDSVLIDSDADTRTKLEIERIYPQYGAIERPDGTVVGLVRIRGLNLDSAPEQIIRQKVAQFDDLVNQQLREDIQLYMPMQQYDPTSQIDMYEERLEDSRIIQNDPLLQEYMSDRISFITAMSVGSYIRRFYLVCEVPKQEVITKEAEASEGKRYIEQVFPGVLGEIFGNIYTLYKGGDALTTDDERKTRQLEELQKRRNKLAGIFQGSLGCKTEQLNADGVGVLVKEFWEGKHINEDEKDGFIRKNPYVKGENDTDRINNVDVDDFDEEEFKNQEQTETGDE